MQLSCQPVHCDIASTFGLRLHDRRCANPLSTRGLETVTRKELVVSNQSLPSHGKAFGQHVHPPNRWSPRGKSLSKPMSASSGWETSSPQAHLTDAFCWFLAESGTACGLGVAENSRKTQKSLCGQATARIRSVVQKPVSPFRWAPRFRLWANLTQYHWIMGLSPRCFTKELSRIVCRVVTQPMS